MSLTCEVIHYRYDLLVRPVDRPYTKGFVVPRGEGREGDIPFSFVSPNYDSAVSYLSYHFRRGDDRTVSDCFEALSSCRRPTAIR